jgi:hypothetical protein
MPAMVTTLLTGAYVGQRGGCSICVHISEWVAGDVSSRLHVCHHVIPGRGMIKTMTNYCQKLDLSKFGYWTEVYRRYIAKYRWL